MNRKHIILASALLLCSVFAFSGLLDTVTNSLGGGKLVVANEQYIDDAFNDALKGFVSLSAIKSVVAVIEGSDAGVVVFNVEVGDVVQAIYDYIDVAWKTALAGGIVLLLMKSILHVITGINHIVLGCALLMGSISVVVDRLLPAKGAVVRRVKEVLAVTIILVVALYFVLPLSISGASFLSKRIARPLVAQGQEGFAQVEQELAEKDLQNSLFDDSEDESTKKQKKNDDSLLAKIDVKKQFEKIKAKIAALRDYFKDKTAQMALWTFKIVAGYLFDCIVFPLASLLAMYVFIRCSLSYCLDLKRSNSLREDIGMTLKQYYEFGRPKRNQSTSEPPPEKVDD